MRAIAILIFLFSFSLVRAQVESTAYDVMLKTLLSHNVSEVSVVKAKEMKRALFLDARELNEFQVSHINNARHVGYDKFDLTSLKDVDKNQQIVVYCSVGYRSEKIAEKLVQAGYTNVQNLYGGIFEWVNESLPVVNNQGNQTDRVHAYSKSWGIWLNKGTKVYE